ncbi:MAG: hypothetical protein HY259_06785 [Chloroflexi bacterium]|nr:hypothetical protein [Chloroflexota bacterium]MBI3733149.1 hypothetical protein [Chloroflexota bacterium]
MRELGLLFGATSDEDLKAQINLLERAFRGPLTAALNRELNRLRHNSVSGQPLLKTLARLYHQHNMRDWAERQNSRQEDEAIPLIVCSEALV